MEYDGGHRPDFVRRYVRRGWWWFLAGAAVSGISVWGEWEGNRDLDQLLSSGIPVVATVDGGYAGGEPIPLRYEHPTFGATQVDASSHTLELDVAPGDRLQVVADRVDPRTIGFPGDQFDDVPPVVDAIPAGVGLVPVLLRWRRVRRTASRRGEPSQPHLARIRQRARPHRGLAVDLYPMEASEGTPPVCSVPLISSGGLPIGGEALPVHVSSGTGRLRWVAVATADEVLWPRRRALGPRPGNNQPFGGKIAEAPRPSPPQVLPPGRLTHNNRLRLVPPMALTALGMLVLLPTAAVVFVHHLDAREFERDGVEVPAEVVGIEAGTDELTVEYTPEGEERSRRTTVGVDFVEDWKVGQETLAVVDPDDPTRARLLANRYDAALPLFFASLFVLPGLVWLVRDRRFVRRLRRLQDGPWHAAELVGSAEGSGFGPRLELQIARPGSKAPSATVLVGGLRSRAALADLRRTPVSETYLGPILVAGVVAPGEAVVLRVDDDVVPALRWAKAPKRTTTWELPDRRVDREPGLDQSLVVDAVDVLEILDGPG